MTRRCTADGCSRAPVRGWSMCSTHLMEFLYGHVRPSAGRPSGTGRPADDRTGRESAGAGSDGGEPAPALSELEMRFAWGDR